MAHIQPITLRSGRKVTDPEEDTESEHDGAARPPRMHSPPPGERMAGPCGSLFEEGEEPVTDKPSGFRWKIDPRLRTEEQKAAMQKPRPQTETEPVELDIFQEDPESCVEEPKEVKRPAQKKAKVKGEPDAQPEVVESDSTTSEEDDQGVLQRGEPDAQAGEDEDSSDEQGEETQTAGARAPGFKWAKPGPGARPVTDLAQAMRKKKRRVAKLPEHPAHPLPAWDEECARYLQEDWGPEYEDCPYFSKVWAEIHSDKPEWPRGYRLHEQKLLHWGRLCVPWKRVMGTIQAHHIWNAHQGPARLLPELALHYEFPPHIDIKGSAAHVRKHCLVCQACLAPNFSMSAEMEMTPIPPRAWFSVSLDIFFMPEVHWRGQMHNGYLMCVDRHTGWMVARPSDVRGAREEFTGEKAAHLLLDGSWGELGVPSIITCDLGAQFISQWWETMCSRLGIRQAFSQAHHHQANGRAEVAGRVLQDILQKMHAQTGVNWVGALPRALRIHHDSVDPTTGLRPYQAMFGRLRSMAGLPWSTGELETAQQYFDRMEETDKMVAKLREEAHQKWVENKNKTRKNRPPYQVGDYVLLLKPRGVGGTKTETRWTGPYPVVERSGRNSYKIKVNMGPPVDAHASQLKFCWWEEKGDHILDLCIPPRNGDIVDRLPKVKVRERREGADNLEGDPELE